jgi:hypothetical protein
VLYLWGSSLPQSCQCAVSGLLKVAGHLTVSIELQLQLNAERAFYREADARRFHRNVCERRSFHVEPLNDYRADPSAVLLREIHNDVQFIIGNLRRPFPPSADYFIRATWLGADQNENCDQTQERASNAH